VLSFKKETTCCPSDVGLMFLSFVNVIDCTLVYAIDQIDDESLRIDLPLLVC
jgi:hypothetical protein